MAYPKKRSTRMWHVWRSCTCCRPFRYLFSAGSFLGGLPEWMLSGLFFAVVGPMWLLGVDIP